MDACGFSCFKSHSLAIVAIPHYLMYINHLKLQLLKNENIDQSFLDKKKLKIEFQYFPNMTSNNA